MARSVYVISFHDHKTNEHGVIATFGSKTNAQEFATLWMNERWPQYPLTAHAGWGNFANIGWRMQSKEALKNDYDFLVCVDKMEVR